MKINQRVIRKGDYYELETFEDLVMQQKTSKKEEQQSATSIPLPSEYIATDNFNREQALKAYFIPASATFKTDDFGLNEYQSSLEELLKQSLRDEQRFQIEKLLNEIAEIKSDGVMPLNQLLIKQKKQGERAKEIPQQITLTSEFNVENLQKQIRSIEDVKFIELSRLEYLIQILLGETKPEQSPSQNSQLDEKTKEQIESAYNNLSSLTCLNSLQQLVNRIAANEIKYVEMAEWVSHTEELNSLNKQILDEFENDELVLRNLEQNFKANVDKVRSILKKLSMMSE